MIKEQQHANSISDALNIGKVYSENNAFLKRTLGHASSVTIARFGWGSRIRHGVNGSRRKAPFTVFGVNM